MATQVSERRNRRGYYSVSDVAELLGEHHTRVFYHIERGYIPRPQHRDGKSTRRYYSTAEVEAIKEYWLGEHACQ